MAGHRDVTPLLTPKSESADGAAAYPWTRAAPSGGSRRGHPPLDRGGPGTARRALARPQRLAPDLAGDLAPDAGPADPEAGPPRSGCRRPLLRRRGCSMAAVEVPPPDPTPGPAVLRRTGAGGLSMAEAGLGAFPDRGLRPALDGADRRLRHGAGHDQ